MPLLHILFVTDSRTHNHDDTLFPMARYMAFGRGVRQVSIIDRAAPENAVFFDTPSGAQYLHVYRANDSYDYASSRRYLNDTSLLERRTATEFDAVIMMMDQPVADNFLLDLKNAFPDAFFVNDPEGALELGNKAYLERLYLNPELTAYIPQVAVLRSASEVRDFRKHMQDDVILKTLQGYGGSGIKRFDKDFAGNHELEAFMREEGAVLGMKMLRNPKQSDNRILVVNGEIIGVMERRAAENGWLCNICAGASVHVSAPTGREKRMVAALRPILREKGIVFAGIDTLKDEHGYRYLSEINTLNTGGLTFLEEMTGIPYVDEVASIILARIMEECRAVNYRLYDQYQRMQQSAYN